MPGAVFKALIGVMGLAIIRWIGRWTHSAVIGIAASAWALFAYLVVSRGITAGYVRALMSFSHPGPGLPIAGLIAVVALMYGLARMWPVKYGPLGFTRQGVLRSVGMGTAVGIVLGSAFSQVWSKVSGLSPAFGMLLLCSNVVPFSVLEEGLFRGRIMGEFSARIASIQAVLWLQAVVYAAAHYDNFRFAVQVQGAGCGEIARQLAVLTIAGYAYGTLFLHKGNLWAPAAAHVSCNLLIWMSAASVAGPIR